jgi:hypothetical protein
MWATLDYFFVTAADGGLAVRIMGELYTTYHSWQEKRPTVRLAF